MKSCPREPWGIHSSQQTVRQVNLAVNYKLLEMEMLDDARYTHKMHTPSHPLSDSIRNAHTQNSILTFMEVTTYQHRQKKVHTVPSTSQILVFLSQGWCPSESLLMHEVRHADQWGRKLRCPEKESEEANDWLESKAARTEECAAYRWVRV